MKRRKDWNIASVRAQQMGRMTCCVCNKKITEGEYIYRETEEAYVLAHHACSTEQPIWHARDTAQQAYAWAGGPLACL